MAQTPRWQLVLIVLLLGALAALGQAPWGLWPLTLLAFAGLYGLWRSTVRPGLLGWGFGTGYFALALHWITEPFMVDAATHGWMAPFALFFMAAGLAIFWAGALRIAHGLGALGFVSALGLAEALRGILFTGFPWAQPGHVWIGTPVMTLAAFGGALLLCALTFALAACLWHAVTRARGGLSGAAIAALGLGGVWLMAPAEQVIPDNSSIVRLVQPNAPQHQKWDPEMIPVFLRRQASFTAAEPRPDLVVWPETSVPFYLHDAQPTLEGISNAAGGAPVVVGVRRLDGVRLMNALITIGQGGAVTALYDKHHLVPFGEYIPYGRVLKRFGLQGLAAEDGNGYSSGQGPTVIEVGDLGKALPLICYEGVFPRNINRAPERPDFLLLITNDAWFGTISGPYQHLAQARLRSAEHGLPMIRVANTGVSAMIDARGAVRAMLPLGEAGYVDTALPPPRSPTPYARTGDWPMVALLLLALGGAIATRARSRST